LTILQRIGASDRPQRNASLAVSMSAFSDLEDRIRSVMNTSSHNTSKGKNGFRIGMLITLLLLVISSVKFREVVAQQTPSKSTAANEEAAAKPQPAATSSKVDSSAFQWLMKQEVLTATDNDFLYEIINSPVTEIPSDVECVDVTFEGIVTDMNSQPVAGATVLLYEQPTHRSRTKLSSEFDLNIPKPIQIYSVFAKVTTGANGRYKIVTRWPTLRDGPNSMGGPEGSIVAAHPNGLIGFAYTHLFQRQESSASFDKLDVQMFETTTVNGVLQSNAGKPISDAILYLQGIHAQEHQRFGNTNISTFAVTDDQGRFELRNIPKVNDVFFSFHHTDWDANFRIALDDRPESQTSGTAIDDRFPLLTNPAVVIGDPGQIIHGRIANEQGEPVPNVKINVLRAIGKTTSNSDGTFQLPVKIPQYATKTIKEIAIGFETSGTNYLPQVLSIPMPTILSGGSTTVTLEEGYKTKIKFENQHGEPLDNVFLLDAMAKDAAEFGVTGTDGYANLVLPRKAITLMPCSSVGEYGLPRLVDRRHFGVLNLDGINTIVVHGERETPAELPKVVLQTSDPIEVIVSTPDGQPAIDASVRIFDLMTDRQGISLANPFGTTNPVSAQVQTDTRGRATVVPDRTLTRQAEISVTYTDGSGALLQARVRTQEAVDGALPIVLKPKRIVEGIVMINGSAAGNVVLTLNQTEEITSLNGNKGYSMKAVSTATTDAEGNYSFTIDPNTDYWISISTIDGKPTGQMNHSKPVDSKSSAPINFELEQHDGEIKGMVVDAKGNPLEGYSVDIPWKLKMKQASGANAQLRTDSEGRFTLSGMPPGEHRINVLEPYRPSSLPKGAIDYGMRSESFLVTTGDMNVRLVVNFTETKPMKVLVPKSITPR
jgi:protocatechuate 3,4-dioxygenase beta subunit